MSGRALYSLPGCPARRCQPGVRVQPHNTDAGNLVGATKQAVVGGRWWGGVGGTLEVRFKVSEKDIPDENGLLKRDEAPGSRRHMAVAEKEEEKKKVQCLHSQLHFSPAELWGGGGG